MIFKILAATKQQTCHFPNYRYYGVETAVVPRYKMKPRKKLFFYFVGARVAETRTNPPQNQLASVVTCSVWGDQTIASLKQTGGS